MKETTLVSMLRSYWLEKWMSVLLLVLGVFLFYLSFGQAYYFDKLFLLVVLGLLTVFRNNKDLFFTLLLLLICRATGEAIYLLSDKEYVKWGYYLASIFIVSKLKYDRLVPVLIVPMLCICLSAELYWYLIGYDAPELHYYVLGLAINCLLRHFLAFKAHFKFYSNLELVNKPLDYSLYKLNAVSCVVTSILIIEYLVRHLTKYKSMVVYDIYSYILQIISVVLLYLVIDFSIKSKFKLSA